jgi:hypothetical protein
MEFRMRLLAALVLLVFASACNLSNSPVFVEPPTPSAAPTQVAATAAPTVTPLPGLASSTTSATRTPFPNGSAPTTQPLAGTSTFPTPATGERAEIVSPANGASVGGSPLYVSGVVHNLTEDKFLLQVFDSSDQPISVEQTITLSNPNHVADVPWSASVTLRYTGAAQIRISAKLADGTTAVIGTASVSIVPGTPASVVQPANGNHANGMTAAITSPTNGMSVAGNPITVTGTAGGLADNQFTLLLLAADSGTVINSQVITLSGAEANAVPWSASLGTSAFRGRAEIRAVTIAGGQQVTLASVVVTLQ